MLHGAAVFQCQPWIAMGNGVPVWLLNARGQLKVWLESLHACCATAVLLGAGACGAIHAAALLLHATVLDSRSDLVPHSSTDLLRNCLIKCLAAILMS